MIPVGLATFFPLSHQSAQGSVLSDAPANLHRALDPPAGVFPSERGESFVHVALQDGLLLLVLELFPLVLNALKDLIKFHSLDLPPVKT
jgi:hypothetical protein